VKPSGSFSTTQQAPAAGVSREAKRESACSQGLQLGENFFGGNAEAGFVFSPALLEHGVQLLALFGVHVREGIRAIAESSVFSPSG